MKAVQIGILAALLLVAGLLYKVYRGQQAAPPATVAATQSQAPAAASVPESPATPAPVAEPAPAPAPAERARSEVREHRPSAVGKRAERSRELAQNRAPEPAPPAQAAAQAPPSAPAAPAQPPQSTPPQEVILPTTRIDTPPPPRQPHKITIPAGTSLTVRLGETLSTARNRPGDTFTATLDQPLIIDGLAIAERGARVEGKVVQSDRAGRVSGTSRLELQLSNLHASDGQVAPIETALFSKVGETSKGSDVKKIGAGAAIGAAIGAIAGGGKGAAIGAGVGGAAGTGTVMATRGKDAEIPVETRLTFRLQNAVTLTEKLK
jgi:hypothetical protein